MKLLGWMHRKLRQNSAETLQEFSNIGQSSLGLQQYYSSKPYHGSRTLSKTQKENHLQKSFSSLESAIEKDLIEEPSASSELFHGFLAIGTLGTNPFTADSSTPTFSISVENLTEKETEVTSSALRLINEVKVLGADNNDGSNGSSGRNSLASCGRSSQGSTIGHSGKPEEGSGSSVHGPIICPLQGYLFGTAMGMPETTVSKKEKRISLGELFEKTKIAENSGIKDKRAEKESDTSAVQLMKKILKKKMIHASSRSSTSTRGTTDSAKVYKKRPKIPCIFHRKVHPEVSVATENFDKVQKNGTKNIMNEDINADANKMPPCKYITIYPQRVLSRKGTGPCKIQINLPQNTLDASDSCGNREQWIKTDTNCVYKNSYIFILLVLIDFSCFYSLHDTYITFTTDLRTHACLKNYSTARYRFLKTIGR